MKRKLCHESDIEERTALGCEPDASGQDTVFLVRRGQAVHAYRDACPHLGGTPMAWRRHAYLSGDGAFIVCHAHGARFDKVSGVCLAGPCLGESLTPVPLIRLPNGDICIDSPTTETS